MNYQPVDLGGRHQSDKQLGSLASKEGRSPGLYIPIGDCRCPEIVVCGESDGGLRGGS